MRVLFLNSGRRERDRSAGWNLDHNAGSRIAYFASFSSSNQESSETRHLNPFGLFKPSTRVSDVALTTSSVDFLAHAGAGCDDGNELGLSHCLTLLRREPTVNEYADRWSRDQGFTSAGAGVMRTAVIMPLSRATTLP